MAISKVAECSTQFILDSPPHLVSEIISSEFTYITLRIPVLAILPHAVSINTAAIHCGHNTLRMRGVNLLLIIISPISDGDVSDIVFPNATGLES